MAPHWCQEQGQKITVTMTIKPPPFEISDDNDEVKSYLKCLTDYRGLNFSSSQGHCHRFSPLQATLRDVQKNN